MSSGVFKKVKLKNSLSELSVGIVAFIAFWCFLALDKILLVHNSDFRSFVMGQLRSRDAGQYLPGATGDFLRSLGISEYPSSLILDLPWLIATHVPTETLQLGFGLATYMSLYLAVNLLGKRCAVNPVVRQTAGFLLPLLMVFPSTISWNRFPLYASSFGWMVATLTLGLLAVDQAKRKSSGLSLGIGLIVGCVTFLANIHYLPMAFPVVVLGASSIYFLTKEPQQRQRLLWSFGGLSVGLVLNLPVFLGTYLFGVWAIPEVAVQENIDRLSWGNLPNYVLPFPAIGNLPLVSRVLPSSVIQLLMLIVVVVAGVFAHKQGRKILSLFGLAALAIYLFQATAYGIAAIVLKRELGLDPHYTEILAYPLWILLVTDLAMSKFLHILRGRALVRAALPILLIAVWTGQWAIRNDYQRLAPPEYPIRLSLTTQHLTTLIRKDNLQGSFSRTIIIQARYPADRGGGEGYRIRRAGAFTESFLMELTYARIPVLNAYTHMISPRAFEMTNRLFGDGRPAWRQFSSYDVANVDEMPELGIRYVLSEVPLNNSSLRLISSDPYLSYGLFPAPDVAYLYEVIDTRLDPRITQYDFKNDRMYVSVDSSTAATVTIPIEYSRCIRMTPVKTTSEVTMGSDENGLVTLSFVGRNEVVFDYNNSVFQIRNCRIRDYFDFRSELKASS